MIGKNIEKLLLCNRVIVAAILLFNLVLATTSHPSSPTKTEPALISPDLAFAPQAIDVPVTGSSIEVYDAPTLETEPSSELLSKPAPTASESTSTSTTPITPESAPTPITPTTAQPSNASATNSSATRNTIKNIPQQSEDNSLKESTTTKSTTAQPQTNSKTASSEVYIDDNGEHIDDNAPEFSPTNSKASNQANNRQADNISSNSSNAKASNDY